MTRLATPPSAPARLWSTSATLWIITLSVMAVFQFWRGAAIDGVIFAAVALVVVVERVVRTRRPASRAAVPPDASTEARPSSRRRLVAVLAIALVAGVIIVVAPRTGPVSISLVAALGIGAVALVWNHSPSTPAPAAALPPPSRHRARIAWASLGIALCIWEAVAYILSVVVPRGWIGFPTVSLLLEPAVDFDPSRALLTVFWLAAGVWLVAVTVTRSPTTRSTTRSITRVGERP